MQMKDELRSLAAYVPGKSPAQLKKEYNLAEIYKLASNENPFGCSPKVLKQLFSNGLEMNIYPDGYGEELRIQLEKRLGVSKQSIIFGAGADEVIQYISRGFLSSGDRIICGDLTFPQYAHHAVIEGAEVVRVPLIQGKHDLKAMVDHIDENTKIIWVCNPNNPTGTYVNDKEFKAFMEKVPPHVLVVSDEAYYEYVDAGDYPQTLQMQSEFPNLFVLRTFSKAYGLANFRIGYGIGSEEIIQMLHVVRLPFNTSGVAQLAAGAALEDEDFLTYCVKENSRVKSQLEQYLIESSVKYYPSQANFIYIEIENSQDYAKRLEQLGYIVRPFPSGLRITIGTEEINKGLIQALRQINIETQP